MNRAIDPKVDCVFKAVLGSESHSHLLTHFLNHILGLNEQQRVISVQLLNPFNPKALFNSKGMVVDVRARDRTGREFQLELQARVQVALGERMLLNWAAIYHARLKQGMNYGLLKPVTSIWLLGEDLFPQAHQTHLKFQLRDEETGILLSDHCGIHVLQLAKCPLEGTIIDDKWRWLNFFKQGKYLNPNRLPDWMQTEEMLEAMNIVQNFALDDDQYHLYLSRQDAQAVEETLRWEKDKFKALAAQALWEKEQAQSETERERFEKEQAQSGRERERFEKEQAQSETERERFEKEQAQSETERERFEKEQALSEKERLLSLLQQNGIDPDQI